MVIRDGAAGPVVTSINDPIGGGILNFGTLDIFDSTLTENLAINARGAGGGIGNLGTLIITNSIFYNNETLNGGGGIYNYFGNVDVTNVGFTDNSASSGGGGIYTTSGTVTVDGSSFDSNTAGTSGGGIFSDSATVDITGGSLFSGNRAVYGGAIAVVGTSVLSVYSSNLVSNSATEVGGGIYSFHFASANINGSALYGNSATFGGGGLFNDVSTMRVANSTLTSNNSSEGGGIFNSAGATLLLVNNTIVGNSATSSGGGVVNNGVTNLYNNIIHNNSGGNCDGGRAITYGAPNLGCDGSVVGDPQLYPAVSVGGIPLHFPLIPGSPAIDAGDNSVCPATDLLGALRPQDGNGDAIATCDLGAIEADEIPVTPTATFTPTATATSTATYTPTATFTFTPTSTATFTPTFSPTPTLILVNRLPIANADTFTVAARSNTIIPPPGVLANDTDPEGASLSILDFQPISAPRREIDTTLNPDGSLSVELGTGGTAGKTYTYSYSLYDGVNIVTGSLTIVVVVNQPPVTNPDTFTIPASSDFIEIPAPGVLVNDTDPEGSTLTVNRTFLVNNGINVAFNATGDGGFWLRGTTAGRTATFTYRVSDGVNTVTGTLTIVVTANQPPVANPDTLTIPATNVSRGVVIPASSLLANDTDPEGTPLTVVASRRTQSSNGIEVDFDRDGNLRVLAPIPGRAATFSYSITDGPNTVTGTLRIVVTANQPPVANPDTFYVPATGRFNDYTIPAPNVLANDTDPEGSPLQLRFIDQQAGGIVIRLNSDGSIRVRGSTAGQTGIFSYTITDGRNNVTGSFTIIVTGNQPPVANPDTYTIPASSNYVTLPVPGVLANDTDPEGSPLRVDVNVVSQTRNGIRLELNRNGDGSFRVLGAIPGRTGTFTYRLSDGVNTVTGATTIIVR